MKIYLQYFCILISLFSFGCSEHKVDTYIEWCEQINGVDIMEKYAPFWAVFPSVSFHGDAIRDDYTESLNMKLLELVENRAPKMAWREGTEFHLVNLSSLLVIEPDEIIDKWRNGIELSKEYRHKDPVDKCVYGIMTNMFDSLHIHTLNSDGYGLNLTEEITIITTDRAERLKKLL